MLPQFFKKKLLPFLMVFGFVCLGSLVSAYADYTFFQELTECTSPVSHLAFSSSGDLMVFASSDGSINICYVENGFWNLKQSFTLTNAQDWANKMVVSSDGQTIILGSFLGTIEIWKRNSENVFIHEETLNHHDDNNIRNKTITLLAISHDAKAIISCSNDALKKICIFQNNQWQSEVIDSSIFSQENHFYLNAELQTLISHTDYEEMQIWNLQNNGAIDRVGTFRPNIQAINVAISPDQTTDQTTVVFHNTSLIQILSLVGGQWISAKFLNNPFMGIDLPAHVALNETIIVLWLDNGQMQVIEKINDEWTLREQLTLDERSIDKPYSTTDTIRSVAVSPDKMLAIGCRDGSVKIYSSEDVFGRCGKKRKSSNKKSHVESNQEASDESSPKKLKASNHTPSYWSYCTLI